MIFHLAITVAACTHGCVVAAVAAVCAAPCVGFDQYNAFLLLFQIEDSEGTSATTVTRRTMELTSGSAMFYGWK